MYRIVALLKKRDGMSMDDFINHYETRHAPMARRLFPEIKDYRRLYVRDTGPRSSEDEVWFDCILSLTYDSEADANAMYSRLAENEEVKREVEEDEERLFDRSRIRTLVIEEHVSPLP